MTFNEAVKCLKDKKCKFIYREAWGNAKIDNRIKYNSFDVCLEFGINDKIYYAKDVEDVLATDWVAVNVEFKNNTVTKYGIGLDCDIIYSSINALRNNNKFNGEPIVYTASVISSEYIEESNFYKCYYDVDKEDIIFEMASLLDRAYRIIPAGKLERDIEKTLRKVSDGDLK